MELAAKKAGFEIKIPFAPGRVDAEQEHVDVNFWSLVEPFACGFRNYIKDPSKIKAEVALIDKAQLLTLKVTELVVLIGGLRVLGATYRYSNYGVLTENKGVLTNDFFINLLDMSIAWEALDEYNYTFKGIDRRTGNIKWVATRVDLIFGHHDELRAIAEVYASSDGKEKFIEDFVKTWTKVIHLDRFDLWRNDRKLYKKLTAGI